MPRTASEIPLSAFIAEFGIKTIHRVSLYVDEKNKDEIFDIISQNRDRFRRAVYVLLQGNYNNELYGKENISKKTYNLTAIKFKKRKNANYRIYCKEYIDEYSPNIKKVVMVSAYNKKSMKISKKLKQHLNTIAEYEYNL